MDKDLEKILAYLKGKRGFDFSGYRPPMLERRVGKRLKPTKSDGFPEYLKYLQKHTEELDELVDVLTINVSRFFRNTLAFDYIADRILPAIVSEKKGSLDHSLRVWSAGCATGEEPYSIAILILELQRKEKLDLAVNIFATDIDERVLKRAKKALYPYESIKSMKYRLLKRYFEPKKKRFQLTSNVQEMVDFSIFDMISKKGYAPPESVFGNFDMIFCKNVLIYFSTKHQDRIFNKLYRSLAKRGYLVLGRAEAPTREYQNRFRKVSDCGPIYQKR
ncbi:MAG: protein-glutamate O-methyltransferase CheR [Deltaproteobacteria bacterium]|nr:protein-glutamate O-methyltransferase CheR [Deltaproteobacteria bacterium]